MKKTRIIALALAAVMVMGSSLSVFAASDEIQTFTQAQIDGAKETTVKYNEGASFTVVIPKLVNISTDTKSATYDVVVEGDIKSDMKVTVTPDASFDMIDDAGKKANVEASVDQPIKEWNFDDSTEKLEKQDVQGTITADKLTAGEWTGTFDFTIAYVDAQ